MENLQLPPGVGCGPLLQAWIEEAGRAGETLGLLDRYPLFSTTLFIHLRRPLSIGKCGIFMSDLCLVTITLLIATHILFCTPPLSSLDGISVFKEKLER